MGVSGSGKTTIGQLLAKQLGLPYFDADDFHPLANIQKMEKGLALNDTDRQPWLEILSNLAKQELQKTGAVISCSALKQSYRATLKKGIEANCQFIFLKGSFQLIRERMEKRAGHFMPTSLLQSQFDVLENPENALVVDIAQSPESIIQQIMQANNTNTTSEFGLIGLGVMGKSLSLNLAEKGFKLSLYNRHETGVEEKIAQQFIQSDELLKDAQGFDELISFVQSLSIPRKIFMMIKAGPALDQVIEAVLPHLNKGDVLIDGGNTHYQDTSRRLAFLQKEGIHFIGAGVSGGEEGARHGPSIMPGGSEQAYPIVRPYLEAIAAKDQQGNPCCTFIGREGAGHFVKMVHNGIEYAEMQLLAECYGLLRFGAGHSPDQIADLFEIWMSQGLNSYLLEITVNILRKKEADNWLIDQILDKAGNKGTGSWTSIAAAELGVPVTMITAALYARYTSSYHAERVANSQQYTFSKTEQLIEPETLKAAYELARILNHHQGIQLISAAGQHFNWQLQLSEIARIWTNGCIIRSALMEQLVATLPQDENCLNIPEFRDIIHRAQPALDEIVMAGIKSGAQMPCLMAAQQYLLAMTSQLSTANIIQAQRDYFGAHRYQRTNDPTEKFYHTNW